MSLRRTPKFDPATYWDRRYAAGRGSGEGSRGDIAVGKAAHVNDVVARYEVRSLIDWGCGDGEVLGHITTDIDYLGVDVSPTILTAVRQDHPDRTFRLPAEAAGARADLALSMDVLFHFPDDGDYRAYLDALFDSAERLVLIYSTNYPGGMTARHVNRRCFTPDIVAWYPTWELTEYPEGPGEHEAQFFLYEREAT